MTNILTEEKVKQIIEEYMNSKIKDELKKFKADRELDAEKLSILERIVRVEEELKAQRDLMEKSFEQVDKRFEELRESMDKRFEQVDKRFEDLIHFTDKRIKLLTQIIFAFNIPILIGIIGLLIKSFLP